ncbi:nitrate/nitrite transporter NrtS [Pelagicoccus mobilis]|uniref:Nitrate/nitrite transporter NrtS n=1 Tax=Pelagicoccus mobilis TaxID=415221 RepID=A0A934RTM9_9BACT|nr:nitrate/nitrite transporter NrtS [Pelagicoccus mobilis]MBK1876223.1 nitrate/nitrite transporter NrtS [Pelagicoccus mobilis]
MNPSLLKRRLKDAIRTALVVGSILTLINQYDAIWGDKGFSLAKSLLSYLVPFLVSMYASRSRK